MGNVGSRDLIWVTGIKSQDNLVSAAHFYNTSILYFWFIFKELNINSQLGCINYSCAFTQLHCSSDPFQKLKHGELESGARHCSRPLYFENSAVSTFQAASLPIISHKTSLAAVRIRSSLAVCGFLGQAHEVKKHRLRARLGMFRAALTNWAHLFWKSSTLVFYFVYVFFLLVS